jgi:nitrite reductase (NO-forming)
MNQHNQEIYRTTSARTGKMMAIMLGICIVGGVIFFSMWDYWTSTQAPVVAKMAGESEHEIAPGVATGKHMEVSLNFIESSDFKTLAFNALPGEEGHNPTINANVGDEIVFNVANNGKSFHAFGVTKANEGFAGVISTSAIKSASNPLKPGESGTSEFIPSEEGTYYYICTVPGHREQGMVGEIIVSAAKTTEAPKAAAPTGVHHDFSVNFIESSDFKTLAFNALPGEEGHNPEFRVKSGDEITFSATNAGKSFHAFGIASDPENFNNVLWNSAIASASNPLKPGQSGSVTFTAGAPGTYYYICTVPGHALQGMKGSFIVE